MDFQDLTSFSLLEPIVYTANVSMGATVNFFMESKLGLLVLIEYLNVFMTRWCVSENLCISVFEMRRR